MKTTAAHRPLQTRIDNQQQRIDQGLKSGSLTKDEAAPLQARLDAMKKLVTDGFDKADRPGVKEVLNGLSKDIHSAKHNEVTDPQQRSANIESRLTAGLKDGSLTQTEYDGLKKQSDALKSELASAQTPEAKQAVATKLEQLSGQVFKDRHDGELDAGKRVESFVNRIKAGVADGSLTSGEAARLAIRTAALKVEGDAPSAKDVNSLNRAIYRQRHDAQKV